MKVTEALEFAQRVFTPQADAEAAIRTQREYDELMRRRGEALVQHLETNAGPSDGAEMTTTIFPFRNDNPEAEHN